MSSPGFKLTLSNLINRSSSVFFLSASFSSCPPSAAAYTQHGDVFLILEPDVKVLRNARHQPDTDGDGI
jgi:hypothetical protein